MPREPLDLPDDESPRPRKGSIPGWAWAVVAVCGFAVVGCCGGCLVVFNLFADHGERRAKAKAEEAARVASSPIIDAATLYAEFQADGAAAAAKYGSRELRVRLRVDKAEQWLSDRLRIQQDINRLDRVHGTIPVGDASRIKTGNTVVVRGVVRSSALRDIDLGDLTIE